MLVCTDSILLHLPKLLQLLSHTLHMYTWRINFSNSVISDNSDKMRNSKVGSMKHTHLFRCEDQRSQDHKKIVQDRLEGNSFVTREVPIHRLFNVGQCGYASGDLSGFSGGNNFSAGMNVMDYDMPELVVFIQEDHQQFVKDICIDRGVSPEGKCLSEDCELDLNIISCSFDPNMKSSSDSKLRTMEMMSTNSNGSECTSQHPSIKDAMKKYDCRNLMMEGEVVQMELDSGDKIPTDHPTKKMTSETRREVLRKEADLSRSVENWQINSILGRISSRMEFPHCADCLQFTDTTSMSTPEMGNSHSLTGSGKVDYPEETSSCAVGPQSRPTSYTGPVAASSCASHQSNDSISSTHSFAFPILPAEWNGSPVRMMEADKSQSRKQQWRKIWFPCCKC